MDSMKKKKLIDNSLTYGLVIACWAVVQIMMATGHMTSLMKGLLVPLCMYVILAVSLNLTVGILGELSLGHAGFMCVGAFSGAFFTKLTAEAIPNLQVRFILALIIGALVAALFGILIGIPVLRLRGDYLAIVTLAFGEIIKNVINVLYVGADANGIHIAMKKADLNLQEGGQVIIEGAKGITGTMMATGHMTSLMKGLLVPLCMYVILAVSLNLTVGILGELSLGHAGFMCVGAFSGAFFTKLTAEAIPNLQVRFILALIIGALVAALFGILIGIPVLRLRGDYLAIVTLAFGEIIKNVINVLYVGADANGIHIAMKKADLNLQEGGQVIIEGAKGITGTPKAATFAIGIILVLLTLFIVLNLMNSRSGRAIMAIRDNRIAAESVGINITKYKLMAFSISASLAGVAGVLYAHNLSSLAATPKSFGYNMSIMILVYVVLGGIGNIRGSIIAAVILTLLPELLRGLNNYRMLIYAVVLIVMMLFNSAPKAIAMRERIMEKFHKKNAKEAA